jgi:Holliday junction DNA helicase RuvA
LIAQLSGALVIKEIDQVVVDVHGVGYRVFISTNCFYALPEPPAPVTLLVHTEVREDAFRLFGFLTPLERRLFRMLLSVSGIGPKSAMAALSGYAAPDLLASIAAADARALSRIPGIGKKTAERIIVDLRDKSAVIAQEESVGATTPLTVSGADRDAVSALHNLGFKESDAERAVSEARSQLGPQAGLEDIVRSALKRMMKG